MPESVEGDLPFFEDSRRAKPLNRRVLGPWRYASLAVPMLLRIIVFGLVMNAVPYMRDYPYAVAGFVVFVVVTIAIAMVTRRFVVARIRGRRRDRGAPRRIHVTYRVSDEGFQMEPSSSSLGPM